jgi:Na+/citrate or Na+/malate symporter
MLTYTIIVFVIFVIGLMAGNDSDVVEFFVLLPLFGRLFGWW